MVASVVSAGGALGVGSVLGQWIGAAHDRRGARAAVLRALSEVESARWTSGHSEEESTRNYSLDEFRVLVRDFQTASLVAGLPRDAVDWYCDLALAARHASRENAMESNGEDYNAGSIDPELGKVVRRAARDVAGLCWTARGSRSLRWRLFVRPRLRRSVGRLNSTIRAQIEGLAGWGSV